MPNRAGEATRAQDGKSREIGGHLLRNRYRCGPAAYFLKSKSTENAVLELITNAFGFEKASGGLS